MFCYCCVCHAEDGIRDLVRSRGLGDVYKRQVLPRVLSLAQVEHTIAHTDVEIEVFGYGSLCVMVEGRCALSAYATGSSPNCQGAVSYTHLTMPTSDLG